MFVTSTHVMQFTAGKERIHACKTHPSLQYMLYTLIWLLEAIRLLHVCRLLEEDEEKDSLCVGNVKQSLLDETTGRDLLYQTWGHTDGNDYWKGKLNTYQVIDGVATW